MLRPNPEDVPEWPWNDIILSVNAERPIIVAGGIPELGNPTTAIPPPSGHQVMFLICLKFFSVLLLQVVQRTNVEKMDA